MIRFKLCRLRFAGHTALIAMACSLPAGGGLSQPPSKIPPALQAARQVVVVTTSDWNSVTGQLRRFERVAVGDRWRLAGSEIPVVVGRNGLAWGTGLHPPQPPDVAPRKKEGDGRSPAGVFRLSAALGYADPVTVRELKLPYTQSVASTECVDDVASTNYNSIVDRTALSSPDWRSSEQMRRPDELYRWVVVVDHNADKPAARGGSCIFLHIWGGPTNGTAGCTAMQADLMKELLFWLDPVYQPVLVQLPAAVYERLQSAWSLPR